jgi:uncharacterized phage protein (TIGR01671 family)
MREIKFRGWHVPKNQMFSSEEMAFDQLTLLTTGEFINVHGGSTKMSTIYPREKFIPLQFTGLKDRNGKGIYEGDIVEFYMGGTHDGERNEVEFIEDSGYFFPFGCHDISWEGSDCIVIGNIYENPELLKG